MMGSSAPTNNHALVFGASGVSGWAIVNAIVNGYPTRESFRRVTALTNRALPPDVARWPASEKLDVVSGFNLLQTDGQSELEAEIKARIPGVENVSIIYFFAYVMDPEPEKEIQINIKLLERAVKAVENLSKNLRFVVLPTGTKAYGVHLLDKFPWGNHLPLKESLPRIPEPYASQMFYYSQIDLLRSLSRGKQWTFCDVIPDIVVGFVPNNNVYCMAQWLALYLTLYRETHGKGATVVFPGTMKSWTIKSNDTSQDVLAKFAIYASLHPEISGGESFNIASAAQPSSWSRKWPIICDYFDLKGVAPTQESGPDPAEFLINNRDKWLEVEQKHNLQTGRVGNDRSFGGYPHFIMSMFDFDRHMDLSKACRVWGSASEELDDMETWYIAFDRFRDAGIIP